MSSTLSRCPYSQRCGGCDYQGLLYAEQLKEKQQKEQKLFGRLCTVSPIVGMENPYYYRNKVHAVLDGSFHALKAGVYRAGTHEVVDVRGCQIEDSRTAPVLETLRSLIKKYRLSIYQEDSHSGFLRHILIRTGQSTGQMLVVLVATSTYFPAKNNFIKDLRCAHPEITSIVLNLNEKRTTFVLGDRDIPLYGPGRIQDKLCGVSFLLSPRSFYQINPTQTEKLYRIAMDAAELTGKERVIDAYCGIGTIGLIAAQHAGEVLGIELNRDAVRDAMDNARRNQIKNARFVQGDAGKVLIELAAQDESVDVVFMDPPRSGSDLPFLRSLLKLQPKKIIYISCDPDTLSRDLETLLQRKEYQLTKLQPVDLFPMTRHIETVATLVRIK